MNRLFFTRSRIRPLFGGAVIVFLLVIVMAVPAFALETGIEFGATTGLPAGDIRTIIANVIRIALGLVGIVMLVLVLYGGWMYMTAQGVAEKIDKAKKIIISAIIGLVIALSAFAIASFIIRSLLGATTGGPGGPIGPGGPGPGGIGPGGIFGCPDPDPASPAPYICRISPSRGPQGSFVTITGGKFGTYDEATSRVVFTRGGVTVPALIASCAGTPAWRGDPRSPNSIVVEVPELVFDAGGLNVYDIQVETATGSSGTKITGGLTPTNRFELTVGAPGPGIACIVPDEGAEGAFIQVFGKRFGDIQSTSTITFAPTVGATPTTWSDAEITTTVPAGAYSGDVVVTRGGVASNGFLFKVSCTQNSQCSLSNCCFQTSYCVEEQYCAAGLGASCDITPDTPQCDPGACQRGLVCSVDDGCTCQFSTTPTFPVIASVSPTDGAPGNFITIFGAGFGAIPGQVIFMGTSDGNGSWDAGEPYNDANEDGQYTRGEQFLDRGVDDTVGTLPQNCNPSVAWSDRQIIISVPEGAVDGPIAVVTTSQTLDTTTTDANGVYTVDFSITDVRRPGICEVSPITGSLGDSVTIRGAQFGPASDALTIGGASFGGRATWLWTDTEISGATVPNLSPARLPVQVAVNGVLSNPFDFTVVAAPHAPSISYINPERGPVGQYVSIFGANFGREEGIVRFQPTSEADPYAWVRADVNFPAQCATDFWKQNSIVVKVPAGIAGDTQIVVEKPVDGSARGQLSNTVPFTVCSGPGCPLRPGICRMSPAQGPVGTTNITLYGEALGSAVGQVQFWNTQTAPAVTGSYWTPTRVGTGLAPNTGLPARLPIEVPSGATTGPVTLVSAAGLVSNQLHFEVSDCRVDANICGAGETCCQADGICKLEGQCASSQAPMCTLRWNFFTGEAPTGQDVPRVVEDVLCLSNSQSPTPWKRSVDACVNALISARFTIPMLTDTLNGANIEVMRCNTGQELLDGTCTTIVSATSVEGIDADKGMLFTPSQDLQPNTWYRVRLIGSETGLRSVVGVPLDGNADGQPGGDYVWTFRTRATTTPCEVDRVIVQPQEATIASLAQSQPYNALAAASNCNLLSANAYDWNWSLRFSDGSFDHPASPTVARITRDDKNNDGRVDWKQVAYPVGQGVVYVGAQPYLNQTPLNVRDDDNRLNIDLGIPEITNIYPNNGLVREEVDTYVVVTGRNFGNNPAQGRVYVGDTLAELAACGTPWTDTQLMVRIPTPRAPRVTPYTGYTPRSLTVLDDGSTVLAYTFDEESTVRVADLSGKNNIGENTGVRKVSGQFGQAISLDAGSGGRNILALHSPTLDLTGPLSIEAWVRPIGGTTQPQRLVISKGDTSGYYLDMTYMGGTGSFGFFLASSEGQPQSVVANNVLRFDRWQHVVATYDGAYMRIYVDGSLVAQRARSGAVASAPFPLVIEERASGSEVRSGELDELFIHARALTAGEIAARAGINPLGGQIGVWQLNESVGSEATDATGNGLTGLLRNDPNRTTGRFGTAVSLNGSTQSIEVPAQPILNMSSELTASLWFRPRATTGDIRLASREEGGDWSIGLNGACGAGAICFRVYVNLGTGTPTPYYAALPITGNVRVNEWNSVVGIFDGKQISIHVNGSVSSFRIPIPEGVVAPLARTTIDTKLCFGARPVRSGSQSVCGGSYFNGDLDAIALYSRALTGVEVGQFIGATSGSHIRVETGRGSATSADTFTFSNRVYPFLCSLEPNNGTTNAPVTFSGSNFGDSNKTTVLSQLYDVGSYGWFGLTRIPDNRIRVWGNRGIQANNPLPETQQSPVSVHTSIEPDSDPYRDTDMSGSFTMGESYVDRASTGTFTQGEVLRSNTLPYHMTPVITSITPGRGPVGQWITITGYNFGKTPGAVLFANERVGEVPNCATYWSDTQVIIVVPSGARSGNLYLRTSLGLESNRRSFEIINTQPGAGICTITPTRGASGSTVVVQGADFADEIGGQGENRLVFSTNQVAAASDWSASNIVATVPDLAISGPVQVIKRVPVGRSCIGFSIGGWCPGGQYDTTYQELPSNSVRFTVSDICETGYIGTIASREAGFPVVPFGPLGTITETGTIATDGNYLYTKAYMNETFSGDTSRIYQIGTGFGGTTAGQVLRAFTVSDPFNNRTPSFTFAPDGYFYTGAQVLTGSGANLQAQAVRYQFTSAGVSESLVAVPGGFLDRTAATITSSTNNLITSNGQYVFNVGITRDNQGYPSGFKVRIFNPSATWSLVREFTLANTMEDRAHDVASIIADTRFIYIIKSPESGEVLTIDWRAERFGPPWRTTQLNPSAYEQSTMEIGGQYDWVNGRMWTGQLNVSNHNTLAGNISVHNRIYRYVSCGDGQTACRTDQDCVTQVCALGVSRCVRGQCTPVITNVEPAAVGVGNWMTVQGCHFGCTSGEVQFWGTTVEGAQGYVRTGIQPNPQVCGTTWTCGANGAADQIIIEVPNKNTVASADDAQTGPIKVITARGFEDTTTDLTPGHFQGDITILPPGIELPNVCRVTPDSGPRGTVAVVRGQNFGSRATNDFVELQSTITQEPFIDQNGNSTYDMGEPYVDLDWDTTNPGLNYRHDVFPSGFVYPYQRVTNYPIRSAAYPQCPASGWEDTSLCIEVPATAVTGNVAVIKEAQPTGSVAQFAVRFSAATGQGPRVEATLPPEASENACRNGIVFVIFGQPMDPATLSGNVILENCGPVPSEPITRGLLRSITQTFSRAVAGLFGVPEPAIAQTCTPVSTTFTHFTHTGRTYAQLTPTALLDTDTSFRIRVLGGRNGVKNIAGDILEGDNRIGDNFTSTFSTSNTVCSLNWLDVIVYTTPYGRDPFAVAGEQRTADLFTCTRASGCATHIDTDQDTTENGNQHIYRAIGYSEGGFGCFDIDGRALSQYTTRETCEGSSGNHCYNRSGSLETGFTTRAACESDEARVWIIGSWRQIPAMPLQTNFTWSRTDNTDPQGVIDKLYAKKCETADGQLLTYGSRTGCLAAGGQWLEDDASSLLHTVQNQSGLLWASPREVKIGRGRLALTAQALGDFFTQPIQRPFDIIVLDCRNPWPSYDEQFPVAQLLNAYNFGTYYCRDAGDPNTTADDLPAAQYLFPSASQLQIMPNTNFEQGTLRSWNVLQSNVGEFQPTTGGVCYQNQWRDNTACRTNPAVASGIEGSYYIGTAERYQGRSGQTLGASVGDSAVGILSSTQFLIEGDRIQFRIGGGNYPWPTDLPSGLQIPDNTVAVTLEIDTTGDGVIDKVRHAATGVGTEALRVETFEVSDLKADSFIDLNGDGIWNPGEFCIATGSTTTCKRATLAVIRLYDTATGTMGHLNFDDLRQLDSQGRAIPIRY